MAQPIAFPTTTVFPRRPHRMKRSIGDKFHEIAMRSPKDIEAFDVLADSVLRRLNQEDRLKHQH